MFPNIVDQDGNVALRHNVAVTIRRRLFSRR